MTPVSVFPATTHQGPSLTYYVPTEPAGVAQVGERERKKKNKRRFARSESGYRAKTYGHGAGQGIVGSVVPGSIWLRDVEGGDR